MIKGGCENNSALFIHLIFHSKIKKNLTFNLSNNNNNNNNNSESGGKSHYETNTFL